MANEINYSAAELADRLKGKLEGNPPQRITGVATLEEAGESSVSWVGSESVLSRLDDSKATVVVVARDAEVAEGRAVIRVDDPEMAACLLLQLFAPPVDDVSVGVHKTALVHPSAEIDGAAIGPFVTVGAGARVGVGTQLHAGVYVGGETKIGRDCVLWPGVVVRERVCIGDRVVIHPNCTLGADGFGYIFRDGSHQKVSQIGTVEIGDDVEIGANSTIDRAKSGVTRVGAGTKIDNLCQIAHNVQIGRNCILTGQTGIAGSTTIGDYVAFGGHGGASDHVNIGNQVQVGAMSVVTRDVADGEVVRGVPTVPNSQFLREQAAVRKLPELLKRVRELEKRLAARDKS